MNCLKLLSKKLFTDKYELVSSMLNYLNLYIEKNLKKKYSNKRFKFYK